MSIFYTLCGETPSTSHAKVNKLAHKDGYNMQPRDIHKHPSQFITLSSLTSEQVRSVHDVTVLAKPAKEGKLLPWLLATEEGFTPEEKAMVSLNMHPEPVWYQKKATSYRSGVLEVIAQEFFRFIYPAQPKTRLIEVPLETGPDYYVISKEVRYSLPLSKLNPDLFKREFKKGNCQGVGVINILALFVNESDLRKHNVHMNLWGRLIKIDGDKCFQRFIKNAPRSDYLITTHSIDNLPFIDEHYKAHNFLDIIRMGERCETSALFDHDMVDLPSYRREINQTILKILMLPDAFFADFVSAYTTDLSLITEISHELRDRYQQLEAAACCSPSFMQYIASDEAKEDFQQYLKTYKQFKTISKRTLSDVITQNEQESVVIFQFLRRLSQTMLSPKSTISIDNSAFNNQTDQQCISTFPFPEEEAESINSSSILLSQSLFRSETLTSSTLSHKRLLKGKHFQNESHYKRPRQEDDTSCTLERPLNPNTTI